MRTCASAESERVEQRVFPAFPHEPYSIQLDFMRALYDTVEAGGIGLFESPTGASLPRRLGRRSGLRGNAGILHYLRQTLLDELLKVLICTDDQS
jgi:Rad3-related DNA helicase